MPFDATEFTRRVFGRTHAGELSVSRAIPYFDHVLRDVVLLKNGGLMGTLRMMGHPFHLADNATRNAWARQHFALLMLLADPQTEVWEHLVSHDDVAPFPSIKGAKGSLYCHEMMQRYDARVLRGLRQIDWYVSIIVHPASLAGGFKAALDGLVKPADPAIDAKALRVLNAKMTTATAAFARLSPVRLGRREEGGALFSEIGEALHLIRTTRRARVPLAQPAGSFGAVLYRDRVVHGPEGFLIEQDGGRTHATYGRMFGFNVYPKKPRVGMFDGLLSDRAGIGNARFVMTNAVRPLNRAKASDKIALTLARLEKQSSLLESDMRDLELALEDLAAGQDIRADHHWSLAVHADSMREVNENAAALIDVVSGAGCSPAPAGMAGKAAYWCQFPGNRHMSHEPATIGLKAFACLSSLDGYPTGHERAQDGSKASWPWGAPLLRFSTAGNTAYDHDVFDAQLGHTLFCGPSGGGKTVCVDVLETAATRLIGDDGLIFAFDKDGSNKLCIINNGGSYTTLQRGRASGTVPLKRLDNTPEDRAIVADLIVGMIAAIPGPSMNERARERIAQAVDFVMRLPAERRTLGAIHAWLPPGNLDPSDSAARLKPWCHGERLGWAFDGEADTVDLSRRMVGVDITALLSDEVVLPIMAQYIMHRLAKMQDGRRIIFVVEEGKFLLPKPEFAARFEDTILTGRKKNLHLWFVIQQPESLLEHPLGPALLGQMRTRFLFKNELANRQAYCGGGRWGDGLHCTPQMFDQVREGMTVGRWSVLIQRPQKSLVCRFDLSSMPEDLAVLSTAGLKEWNYTETQLAQQRQQYIEIMREKENAA